MDDVRIVRRHFIDASESAVGVDDAAADIRPRGGRETPVRRLSFFAVVVLIGMSYTLAHAGTTISFFNDIEKALGNALSAIALDFSVNAADSPLDVYVGVEALGGATIVPVVTPEPGSFPIEYKVTAEKTGGVDELCNALHAVATTTPFDYDGALLALNTATTSITGLWRLEIDIPSSAVEIAQGDVCNVDLVYSGWRDGGDEGVGYQDEERVPLTVRARMIVLNEFLPNPDGVAYDVDFGDDDDTMPRGEWIEIYNNGDAVVDLIGFAVGDATNTVPITAGNTLPAGTSIAAHGWLAVYLNGALLDNDGDTVRLIDPDSRVVDSHVYYGAEFCAQEPTAGSENAGDTASGSCADILGNKSFARIPDGIGAWVDPVPTPGFANDTNVDELSAILGVLGGKPDDGNRAGTTAGAASSETDGGTVSTGDESAAISSEDDVSRLESDGIVDEFEKVENNDTDDIDDAEVLGAPDDDDIVPAPNDGEHLPDVSEENGESGAVQGESVGEDAVFSDVIIPEENNELDEETRREENTQPEAVVPETPSSDGAVDESPFLGGTSENGSDDSAGT